MFQTKRFSACRVLLMLAFLVFIVTLLLPLSLLADGGTIEPPIMSPGSSIPLGGDGLTTVVVTLLAVMWSMP